MFQPHFLLLLLVNMESGILLCASIDLESGVLSPFSEGKKKTVVDFGAVRLEVLFNSFITSKKTQHVNPVLCLFSSKLQL